MSNSGLSTFVNKLVNVIDNITEVTGKLISWLTFFMVLLTFTIVVLRYAFNFGWIALQESVIYFHGLVFMLGAAYTLKADGHVRVDIFYQHFSIKKKALINIFGAVFLLLPVTIFIFFISFDYVAVSFRIMEKSPEAGGLPFVYFNKSFLLLMAMTLVMQGVAEMGRNLLMLFSDNSNLTSQISKKAQKNKTINEVIV